MKTILEIGGGTTPYFLRYDIPWMAGDAYVCLDVNEKRVNESRAAIERLAWQNLIHPENAQFVVRDAVTLPFEDSTVHEIVLSNVLSAPIHYNWDEKGTSVTIQNPSGPITRPIQGTKADGDLFYRERKPLMREALRVLKPGGTLTIYTDLLVYGQHSYDRLLQELGLDMSLIAKADAEEERRIDELNERKLASGTECYCLDAEVLRKCQVRRFTKIY